MTSIDILLSYGMQQIGRLELPSPNSFAVVVEQANALEWECAIYAFTIGDEIVRIGSSKGKLGSRFKAWTRDLTRALRGDFRATKEVEIIQWKARLETHRGGLVFARIATKVTTPVGTFPAYMDEESILINRHMPPLNNSKNR